MLFKDSVHHIFFDLDHTLWDFETNSKNAITELFTEFNLDSFGFSIDEYFPIYLRCNDYCWEKYRNNEMNKDLLRHQRFYLSLKDFGVVDRQLAKKIGKRYVDMSPTKTALMPGTIEILDYLAPKYPLHIITNGFEEVQFLKMRNTGIEKYFTKVITSEKVGQRKPEPKIFKYALKKTNCQAENALMIGDNLEVDIKGAHKVGLQVIWYNHHQEVVEDLMHPSIHHLIELKKYL